MSSESITPHHPALAPCSQRGAAYFVRLGWALVVFGAGGFFSWAALAPLDQGVSVPSTVVVSGKRKAVQSLGGGAVSGILVREGEKVEKGQVLFRLDQTQLSATVQSLQAQYRQALATQARWQSERDNLAQVQFPAELSADADPLLAVVLEGQRQLFASRREAFYREQAGIRARIDGATAQLSGLRQARNDLDAQAGSLRRQLEKLRPLAEEGHIASNRLLEQERQLSQVQQQIARNRGEIGLLKQEILESQLKLSRHVEEYQTEVRGELAEVRLKCLTLEQQLASASFDLQHTEVNAPAQGIAVNLSVHTEGAVVRAGDTLLEIVPQGQHLEVEGRLPVSLVDKVSPALPVDILFTAFNQSVTPRVAGEVSLVSADQLLDEKTGAPYYVIRSSVSEASLEQLNGLVIKPGMPAEMFVRTGERSLLNYLFKPLLDRVSASLTE